MSILVVGSVNMDVVSYVDKHVVPGETVQALLTEHHAGGKGANQAIAALRSGAEVTMVGAVGDDIMGEALLQGLADSGLSCSCISRKAASTGMAFITVDRSGENQIVLSAGANAKLSIQDMEAIFEDTSIVRNIRMMVLQNEIPWELNAYLLQLAGRFGIKTFFNPAPAVNITLDVLSSFHTVILNETEMAAITGRHIGIDAAAETDAEEAVKAIAASGVEEVVLTLGSAGALYANRQGRIIRVAAFPVSVADTTAAGDTFIGAFAAASCRDMEAEERLRFAAAAAALAVSRAGAQSSIPQRDDTLELLRSSAK